MVIEERIVDAFSLVICDADAICLWLQAAWWLWESQPGFSRESRSNRQTTFISIHLTVVPTRRKGVWAGLGAPA